MTQVPQVIVANRKMIQPWIFQVLDVCQVHEPCAGDLRFSKINAFEVYEVPKVNKRRVRPASGAEPQVSKLGHVGQVDQPGVSDSRMAGGQVLERANGLQFGQSLVANLAVPQIEFTQVLQIPQMSNTGIADCRI